MYGALTRMGVVPAVFCVFMVSALVTARVGPFARSTGLDVTNMVQGWGIWWLMTKFLIPAAEKGVVIPGLETEPANGNGPSQCAAMLITANMKLQQYEHRFAALKIPVPNLFDIFFQKTPDTADDAQGEEASDKEDRPTEKEAESEDGDFD